MAWQRNWREEKPIEELNKAQEAFEKSIETSDFDVIHEHRLNKDRLVQDFVEQFGRAPSQDVRSRRYL